jgi:hypothetical protein
MTFVCMCECLLCLDVLEDEGLRTNMTRQGWFIYELRATASLVCYIRTCTFVCMFECLLCLDVLEDEGLITNMTRQVSSVLFDKIVMSCAPKLCWSVACVPTTVVCMCEC